ncbi:MAG: aspartate kinase, partial [Firmicutes bacterium]|nr:aspartate kinase [Bacillota bacterium]
MAVKVAKFGGSSVADVIQLRKIKEIIKSDPERRYIVVSAPGKRFEGDNKITDLLYLVKTTMENMLPFEQLFQVVCDRYTAVHANLGLEVDMQSAYDEIKEKLRDNPSADYIASRGEYLNALLIADFLGFDFVDAEGMVKFDEKGRFLMEDTFEAIRE